MSIPTTKFESTRYVDHTDNHQSVLEMCAQCAGGVLRSISTMERYHDHRKLPITCTLHETLIDGRPYVVGALVFVYVPGFAQTFVAETLAPSFLQVATGVEDERAKLDGGQPPDGPQTEP